jgi:hypothetical protein
MPYQETKYRELPYTFTDPELMVVAKTLSEKLREQATIEENKKTAVSQYDGQLKAVKSIVAVLSENVRRGHEYRSIECRVYLDTPRKGFKTVIRTDTGEIVAEEHMDYSDRQTVIQWEEEQERQAVASEATGEAAAPETTPEAEAAPPSPEQPNAFEVALSGEE